TFVVPFGSPPGGRRLSSDWTTVFGTFQFASVGVAAGAVGRMPMKTVGLFTEKMIGGCERSVAATCTPTLGSMYTTSLRSVFSTGSTRRQYRGSGLSTLRIDAQLSLMARPV